MAGLSDITLDRIQEIDDKADEIKERISYLLNNAKTTTNRGRIRWSGPSKQIAETQRETQRMYEQWYSSARPLVSEYAPERTDQFDELYKGVSSWIQLNNNNALRNRAKMLAQGLQPITTQESMVQALPVRVESEQLRATKQISERITGDEVQHARTLYDEEQFRAAGVIAGVALERHLLTLCETSSQELDFGFMDGISSLAQTLNEGDVITDNDKRLLDYLSGIRNKCAHANEEEPTAGDVDRLISEASDFIRQSHTES